MRTQEKDFCKELQFVFRYVFFSLYETYSSPEENDIFQYLLCFLREINLIYSKFKCGVLFETPFTITAGAQRVTI